MTETSCADDAQAYIAETIKRHPIVLFMKGNPSHPQCGFSAAIVDVLRHYDVPVHAVDVLLDPAVRQGIKTFSDWPTIPQLYADGAFIGGFHIGLGSHASSDLGELIAN